MDTPAALVLIVDDFPTVLAVTALRLRRAGFPVIEAAGGEEALTVLESRDDVAVVLCDCNMPGLTGPELARIVLARWPHIRFIATSGKPPAPDLPDEVEFIHKPYRGDALIAKIKGVLP